MAGFAAVRNYSCNLSLPHHKTLGYSLIIRALRILQGGPKKFTTLQQLGVGRCVICQKFPHFVQKKIRNLDVSEINYFSA